MEITLAAVVSTNPSHFWKCERSYDKVHISHINVSINAIGCKSTPELLSPLPDNVKWFSIEESNDELQSLVKANTLRT